MAALAELKGIILASIPTFFLVWLLYVYVLKVFLQPLQRVLRERQESTAGLRKKAEAAIAEAERKTAEYQDALRAARADVYHLQEQERQKALDHKSEILREARARADEMVASAKQQIHADAEAAKKTLAGEVEQLAGAIATAIVKRRGEPVASGVGGSDGD
jgi:F-type H+-transporting ATPase subunit b